MADNIDKKMSLYLVKMRTGLKGRNNVITWVELDRHKLNTERESLLPTGLQEAV